jgi:hypothetical protein
MPDLNALKLCETRGFSGQFHTKPMFLGQNRYICGRSKHINAVWSAQDAVKFEHEGANRGDDVLVWPLDQRFLKLKLKLKLNSMPDDFYICIEL